jgi:hypothetical protein
MKEENIQVHVENFPGDMDGYEHEYDIIKNGDDIQLFTSKSADWDKPGEFIGSILDNGNEIRIKIEEQEFDLDYGVAQQLLILLVMHNDAKMKFTTVNTIKTI